MERIGAPRRCALELVISPGHEPDGERMPAHEAGLIAGAALLPLLRHPDVVLFECVSAADADAT